MFTTALFGANNGIFEIYGLNRMDMWGRGLSQCEQGEGINFSRFCADVLYGRPIILINLRLSVIEITNIRAGLLKRFNLWS